MPVQCTVMMSEMISVIASVMIICEAICGLWLYAIISAASVSVCEILW